MSYVNGTCGLWLVRQHPQSPLNGICDTGCSFILNVSYENHNHRLETSEKVPYTVTVNEDGTVVFSFNDKEWTYGAEESEDDDVGFIADDEDNEPV